MYKVVLVQLVTSRTCGESECRDDCVLQDWHVVEAVIGKNVRVEVVLVFEDVRELSAGAKAFEM